MDRWTVYEMAKALERDNTRESIPAQVSVMARAKGIPAKEIALGLAEWRDVVKHRQRAGA